MQVEESPNVSGCRWVRGTEDQEKRRQGVYEGKFFFLLLANEVELGMNGEEIQELCEKIVEKLWSPEFSVELTHHRIKSTLSRSKERIEKEQKKKKRGNEGFVVGKGKRTQKKRKEDGIV